jgi:Amt family ammonium transporter
MMMNFMVYGVGMLAFWLIGFAIQMGGVGALGTLGGTGVLGGETTFKLFGKDFGLWGQNGLFLMHKGTYDVAVMVMFLFQMVFMDTALTIVTGTVAERWKYAAFMVSSFVMGAFYPLFANWAWGGGGWARRRELWLGHGYADFVNSGIVHSVGASYHSDKFCLDPAWANTIGTKVTLSWAMTSYWCSWAASFGVRLVPGLAGSTLAASGNGALRIGSVAVNTMLAGMTGSRLSLHVVARQARRLDEQRTAGGRSLSRLLPDL